MHLLHYHLTLSKVKLLLLALIRTKKRNPYRLLHLLASGSCLVNVKKATYKQQKCPFKNVYGRERKHQLLSLADFDPRHTEFRGTTNERLKDFLGKVRGKGLGISLLFNSECRCWSTTSERTGTDKNVLQQRVREFKISLCIPDQKMREIKQSTRDQSQSSLWYSVRRYRITASHFGNVYRRLPTTPPQSLVLRILEPKQFFSEATEWGKEHEDIALRKYRQKQQESRHHGLYYCRSGFVISQEHPFLGASDAVIHDPTSDNPFGLAEVKSPYSKRHMTPVEAASVTDFCSTVEIDSDGQECLNPLYANDV